VLAFAVAGVRPTPVRLAGVGSAAVAVVAAVAVADWLRPAASRTHAGRFVQDILDAALHQWPTLRPTLAAVLTTCAIGAVVNDYGIRLVTYGLITVLPLLALTCVRAAREPEARGDGAPGRTRGAPASGRTQGVTARPDRPGRLS